MRNLGVSATTGVLLAILGVSPACADAIDGHWCAQDGSRRLQIEGPSIVTPGGRRVEGNYDRHHFSYVVPPPDAAAGRIVAMTLLGEMAVQIQLGDASPEVWHRCAPPLSFRSAHQPILG